MKVPLGTFAARTRPQPAPSASRQANVAALDNLERVSAQDADTMLSEMSPSEIQESIRELQTALSPQTQAFLKNRRKPASGGQRAVPSLTETKLDENVPTRLPDADSPAEKERLAEVLSSLRTVRDLDAAYQQEMGEEIDLGRHTSENDFMIACDLLRSSMPRQTLWAARTVALQLQADVEAERQGTVYPLMLPVSLRCLLDAPVHRANGYVLHTYVLQAMYSLLCLQVVGDLAVDVRLTSQNDARRHQECFMSDAIPVQGAVYQSEAVSPIASSDKGGLAYATQSSSTSATSDANAFTKDPLWALLSTMRILPRLSSMLSDRMVPDEAVVAGCGILAMLCQRSQGAATAIAQLPGLLSRLVSRCLIPQEGTYRCDIRLGIPAVVFFSVLARQGRLAAEQIPLESFLLPIVSRRADDDDEHLLQRRTLILWRTLLRYGLCLEPVPTMLALATKELGCGSRHRSVFAELYTAIAAFLRCVEYTYRFPESNEIPEYAKRFVEGSEQWFASHVRDILRQPAEAPNFVVGHAQCLFIQNYLALLDAVDGAANDFVDSSELDRFCDAIAHSCFVPSLSVLRESPDSDLFASACAFVDRYVPLIEVRRSNDRSSLKPSAMVDDDLRELVIRLTRLCVCVEPESKCRIRWISCCSAAILRRLVDRERDLELATALTVSLIGCFLPGDECVCVDVLCLRSMAKVEESGGDHLSSFLLRELTGSIEGSRQHCHSCELHTAAAINVAYGPFQLLSLLPETPPMARDKEAMLLPIGKLWLWRTLSGKSASHGRTDPEALSVISNALALIEIVEQSKGFEAIEASAKLYYLMNLCFQSEFVLQSQSMQVAHRLLELYTAEQGIRSIQQFASECLSHSMHSAARSEEHDVEMTEDERKLADALCMHGTTEGLTESHERSMVDFANDLCDVFLEFAAENAFVTRCLRFFLSPLFPSKVRCLVLSRLKGLLHLLTVPNEPVGSSLKAFLDPGWKSVEFVDALLSHYGVGGSDRDDGGFSVQYLVYLLVQVLEDGRSESFLKQRLDATLESIARRVIATARLVRSGNVSTFEAMSRGAELLADEDWKDELMKLY